MGAVWRWASALFALLALLLGPSPAEARPGRGELEAAVEAGASTGVDFRDTLRRTGWTVLELETDLVKPGQLYALGDLTMPMADGCVEAKPMAGSFKSTEAQGSAGFVVSGSAGGLGVSGSGSVRAKTFRLKSFTETTMAVITDIDLHLTERCKTYLRGKRARGEAVEDWVLIQQTVSARVREVTCTGQEAVAKVRALWIARGEVGEMSDCVESSDVTGVIAYKGSSVGTLLGAASTAVVVAPLPPPPRRDEVRPPEARSRFEYEQRGGLDVTARLREQRCDEEAKRLGAASRGSRLADAGRAAQADARAEWRIRKPELEMCVELNRSDRGGCIASVKEWLRVSRTIRVTLDTGVEPVETKCGVRQPVYEAESTAVAAADVGVAEALLVRLEAADVPTANRAGVIASTGANSVGMRFVSIASGRFEMGCTSELLVCLGHHEMPSHSSVTLTKPFMLQTTEVTQGQWRSVMGKNPSSFSSCGDDCPVEKVSWYDAVEFANALSKQERLTPAYRVSGTTVSWDKSADGYRLPTEAEWEYAARAGQRTEYSGSSELGSVGWYDENSGRKTHRVGQKQANAWGLYDMSGNVREWCWDWYGEYRRGPSTDPSGPRIGSIRVSRGGSWYYTAPYARVAFRYRFYPSYRSNKLGLRLVRSQR